LFTCVLNGFILYAEDSKRKAEDVIPGPAAKSLCTERKCSDLIVLGLPFKSTEDEIRAYFSQFGELVLVQV
jgi:TAR DNA-binding protein 43